MRGMAKEAIVVGTTLTLTLTRKKTRGMAKNVIPIVRMIMFIIIDDLGQGDKSIRLSRSMGL
jgi:hypothetical protein